MNKRLKLAILGCGKLANIIVEAMLNGYLSEYELISATSRNRKKTEALAEKYNAANELHHCQVCENSAELIESAPDYIIETASPNALREIALPALQRSISIIALSIGALADTTFFREIEQTARTNKARVHIASGAIGGFDVLRTAGLMGDSQVSFQTEKGPGSLKGTAVYNANLQHEQTQVFNGNAREAIALFPTKVNVSVAAALATVGPEREQVQIISTPGFVGDTHRIELKSEEVHAVIEIYSKTAAIAGWSVVNTLRNLVAPIVF